MSDQSQDSSPDYGHAIGFEVLKRGTPVLSSDGVQLGVVRFTSNAVRDRIFDGIRIDTDEGARFLDAPEVESIFERAVIATFPAAERETHLQIVPSRLGLIAGNTTTARTLKRLSGRARQKWDRR
jgi:hypothetical protein